ncbi:ATP-binding protein [Pokkaliibacter plantistimulans]|uniref:ATP-binding protein n=1 Tax=Proteobacteria bacterium 228 TaxID=2083153 RepID=A0A2S5KT40_9PROT|nr:ATP-binding protein [Pokkaliibacter plantistimulans]PPC77910.1 ATP-binding protein [Pokkaliibacter plantistimulans]
MPQLPPLELKYSHNIIEHLGLKLYQNRPTNVLAELVSNSWDADAQHVWIDLNSTHVAVSDDGSGMTRQELADNYLVIGKKKRTEKNLTEMTGKKRKLMGRKGIGKLAPFGIARKLSLVTVSKEERKCYWIEIDLEGLLEKTEEDGSFEEFKYEPVVIYDGVSIDAVENDSNEKVKKFLERIGRSNSSGTLVLMESLSLKKAIPEKPLRESIGQRFTVTLLDNNFSVLINDSKVTESQALPEFVFRIPEAGFATENPIFGGITREVKYWVGFVKEANWPQDQAGVGVYTHGKIAQDRPFVFGLKGREISTRYMYGVIEADWLDELDEDVVSTDRTSINWNNDYTEPMYEWGRGRVADWINQYRKKQKEDLKDNIKKKIESMTGLPKITTEEKTVINDMVASMSPKVARDDELQTEIIEKLTSAWTHRPTRAIINSLWDRMKENESDEEGFIATLRDIYKYLVPESLSLSVMVSQRIYALTKLYELSLNGTERQLQFLLESFPWVLGTDRLNVQANKSLKEIASSAAIDGELGGHGYTKQEIRKSNDSGVRPDFVFLSDSNKDHIIVVELKGPNVALVREHFMQLMTYYTWLQEKYPNAEITGYLIGTNIGNGLKSGDPNIRILTWDQVCLKSRKGYLDLLATMLSGVSEHYDDARIKDVIEFGGASTKELLKKMAEANEPLSDIFDSIDAGLNKK